MWITRSKTDEAERLLAIQQEAFACDLRKYEDYDTSPVNEPIDRLRTKINTFYHYTIWQDSNIIGGIDIRDLGNGKYRLNRIFLLQEYQNKGLGTQIINRVESEFPQAVEWYLDTPHLNNRNRHFYEKLGYQQIGEHRLSDKLILIDYKKTINK
ncbi:GNAT family N-acetyltransferase [Ornithinibacillus scapharcae]|uniref:GNAT family N-acetyltransferase n=1 Tax=Ornithinibacillus scapharcae TaxID=1147159 RepID=UPI000225AD08|nr:GNAT family N-acetyltransferase [Ornithinibacillus scapharcae]